MLTRPDMPILVLQNDLKVDQKLRHDVPRHQIEKAWIALAFCPSALFCCLAARLKVDSHN